MKYYFKKKYNQGKEQDVIVFFVLVLHRTEKKRFFLSICNENPTFFVPL